MNLNSTKLPNPAIQTCSAICCEIGWSILLSNEISPKKAQADSESPQMTHEKNKNSKSWPKIVKRIHFERVSCLFFSHKYSIILFFCTFLDEWPRIKLFRWIFWNKVFKNIYLCLVYWKIYLDMDIFCSRKARKARSMWGVNFEWKIAEFLS